MKNPITPLRGLAVAADVAFVDVTTNIKIGPWKVKATIDRKHGKKKAESQWQGYMCEIMVGKKRCIFPINGELFRKLEEDSDVKFFEVEDDKYTLMNFTFGVTAGKLVC